MISDCFNIVRYADAPAALAWMTRTLGLEERFVVPADPGDVQFAVMGLGFDIVASGSLKFGHRHVVSAYGDDVEAHYDGAKRGGAEILTQLRETPYGARIYSARDPEGHIWSFSRHDSPYKPPGVGQILAVRGYADVAAAAEWLERTFGFVERARVSEPSGAVARIDLAVGEGTVICASLPLLRRIGHTGDAARPMLYMQVDDVDEIAQRSRMAGGEIVRPPEAGDHEWCPFIVRDPEGGVWGVGGRALTP